MRKLATIFVVVSVLFAAAPAMATYYYVDLGATDALSDPGIALSNWGEAEAGGGDSGRAEGTYGGIGVGNCRVTWGNTISGDENDWAVIIFPEAVSSVTIRHLNGSQYDSFDVLVDNVLWGSYVGLASTDGGEIWKTTTFSGTAGTTLVIDLTSDELAWRDVWGQLAIDWVSAVPEPATLCLLGLGALGLIRRKR
jgi:hypothetical protein